MDILELIKAQHRQIKIFLSEIENTNEPHKLYECFNQLYQALKVHAEVEGQTFYPAIRNSKNGKLLDAAQKEHNQSQELLEELESLSPTSSQFKQKLRALKQVIQQHVQAEENEVFSQVRELMSKEEREQLGREFAAAKSRLQSELTVAS